MEMASSQVEVVSSSPFSCVLRDHNRHEKCGRDNNNNNIRTVQAVFEKNLKVLVRDHLNNRGVSAVDAGVDNSNKVDEQIVNDDNNKNNDNDNDTKSRETAECSSKTRVLDRWPNKAWEIEKQSQESQISSDSNQHSPSSAYGSGLDQCCYLGQPENPPGNENLGASSLVQIWEARLHHPSHSQTPINSRTSSGLSQTENSCSESLNEDIVKESELIHQPVDEGNNDDDTDSNLQSDKASVSDLGEKERKRVRVMDIIRRLSNEPETFNNNNNGGGNNNEMQTTELRCFPYLACSPRIRGRQAFADLLTQILRNRQKELVWLSERHAVSRFTHRGRLQAMLKIRCLGRCLAIQDRHRSKSAVHDVNRLPQGSSVMHLRGKFKTNNSESSSVAGVDTVANQNSSSSISSRANEEGHDLEASASAKPEASTIILESKDCPADDTTPNKAVYVQERAGETSCLPVQETARKNVLQEATEKSNSSETQEIASAVETAKKAVLGEIKDKKAVLRKSMKKTAQQEATDASGDQENVTKTNAEKSVSSETVPKTANFPANAEKSISSETAGKSVLRSTADENASIGIAGKTNLQKTVAKENKKGIVEIDNQSKPEDKPETEVNASSYQVTEKKANLQKTAKDSSNLETTKRNSAPLEIVDKISTRETANREESNKKTTFSDLADRQNIKKLDGGNRVEADESREIEDKHNPQGAVLVNCLDKLDGKERNEREEEETKGHGEGEKAKEKRVSQDDVETAVEITGSQNLEFPKCWDENAKEVEELERNLESEAAEFPKCWDENEMEEEENGDEDEEYGDYDEYHVDYTYDWFSEISRPRSYWEDLRKQWYHEVLNTDSAKADIRELLERRTVSYFLSSNLRENIDRLMMSRFKISRPDAESNSGGELDSQEEQENHEPEPEQEREQDANQENSEPFKQEQEHNQCHEGASVDSFSRSSSLGLAPAMIIPWSFRDHEASEYQDLSTSPSLPAPSPSSSVPTNHDPSSEMQLISDLRGQMEQLQLEMMELRSSIKSCMAMQLHLHKSVTQDTPSVANQEGDGKKSLKRNCRICYEMPVDSLLYRCGHMCTCLKCAHELQWSSQKCPICLAPIVDVVRAFLDS